MFFLADLDDFDLDRYFRLYNFSGLNLLQKLKTSRSNLNSSLCLLNFISISNQLTILYWRTQTVFLSFFMKRDVPWTSICLN